MKLDFKKIKKVHLIGIGGIGVSAIARIFLKKGVEVLGSDLISSKVTDSLEKLGIKVFLGPHKAENLEKGTDLVVYTVAVQKDNPELICAKRLNIPTLTYPQVLKELTKDHFTIAISGTHGKTTTAALTSLILEKSGLDPTVVLGSNLKEFQGNAHLGESKYFVLEADEYKSAFLNYQPNIIVLTNIEYEHPDCFENLDQIKSTFAQFIKKLPKDGLVIACFDDENIRDVVRKFCSKQNRRVISYGFGEDSEFRISGFRLGKKRNKFQIFRHNDLIGEFELSIPGRHNVLNATAAIAVGLKLGANIGNIKRAVKNYQGAWRRFEIKEISGLTIVDDYAHHPTEIKATLQAAREKFKDRPIICVFQPHQYKRTKALFSDFVGALADADLVIMPEIYYVSGREDKTNKISSKQLVDEIKKRGKEALYFAELDQVVNYLTEHAKKNDVLLILGAGNVTEVGDKLIENLKFKI